MENIILLHGALGCKNQFEALENLLKTRFNVLKLDLIGHGSNNYEKELKMTNFCQQVLNFMKDKNMESAHFFGHSMGGYIALCLAVFHPEKVKNIYTLATKLNWSKEFAEKEVTKLNADFLKEKAPQFVEQMINYHGNKWENLLQKVKNMMISLSNGESLKDDDFKKINSKTKMMLGNKDYTVSAEECVYICSMNSNIEFITLSNSYHAYEKTDLEQLFNQIII